jgi:prepilin-type N-terminal cleavage/methylation domain-containing protein/prepilin-type processing-associated H-X9-DG protein
MRIPSITKAPCHQKGFTLVEVLVVTAIIVILVSLSLPVWSSIQKKRDQVVCLANLRNLGATFHNYAGDNDEKLPLAPNDPNNPTKYWRRALLPYVELQAAGTDVFQTPFFTCPPVRNILVKNGGKSGMNCYAMSQSLSELRLVSINQKSKKILAMEGRVSAGSQIPSEILNTTTYFPQTYHVGGNNILYLDSHVAFWKDISLLTNAPFAPGGAEDMWSP